MARFGLLVTLALGGCLFVGDINQRPSVQLTVQGSASLTVGSPIQFSAELADDQPGPRLELAVLDGSGRPASACAYTLSLDDAPDTNPEAFTIVFWHPGMYSVVATPIDELGAVGSNSSAQLEITSLPPDFTSETPLEPAAATACGTLYPSGAPVPIRLDGTLVDPDASWAADAPTSGGGGVACTKPPSLSLSWQLVSVPDGSSATLGLSQKAAQEEYCPTAPVGASTTLVTAPDVDLVCLYVDADLPTGSPSMYGVTLTLEEGGAQVTSQALEIPAIGNAPACLDGVYPAAGSYVLAGDEVTVFQAIAVDDVSAAASLDYEWSIEGPGDTTFTPLGAAATASEGGDRFAFDPTTLGFGVGDMVQLRVDVSDPAQPAPACPASDDQCMVASCVAAPATTCPRRATWEIEIR